MTVDRDENGGEPCAGKDCRHPSHGVGLPDDEHAGCEARERALLAELSRLQVALAAYRSALLFGESETHELRALAGFKR